MWDFSMILSIRLIVRTLPFLILRLVVAMIWAAILAAAAFGAYVAIVTVAKLYEGGGTTVDPRAWLLVLAGTLLLTGVVFFVLRWLRKWALYQVKAAHIAVLVEFIQGRALPPGTGQFSFGRNAVGEQFGSAVAFFLLDEMIRAALRGIHRMSEGLSSILPNRNADVIRMMIHTFLHFAFSFADEILLAHTFDARTQDASESARRGLMIYGESLLVILKNALWLTVIAAGLGALVYYGVLSPAWAEYQAARNPETFRTLATAVAASLAFAAAFFGPFALICMLQVWFRGVLDEGWSAKCAPRGGPITPQFERYRNRGAAVGAPGSGARNGDIV